MLKMSVDYTVIDLSRAYAWSICDITIVFLTQTSTVAATLDCVTWGEILNCPYDGRLLARHKVTQAMVELWV